MDNQQNTLVNKAFSLFGKTTKRAQGLTELINFALNLENFLKSRNRARSIISPTFQKNVQKHFDIYNRLGRSLEKSKANIYQLFFGKKDFSILAPASMPVESYEPDRLGFAVVPLLVGAVIVGSVIAVISALDKLFEDDGIALQKQILETNKEMSFASSEEQNAYKEFLEASKEQIRDISKKTKQGLFEKLFGSSTNLFLVGIIGLGVLWSMKGK